MYSECEIFVNNVYTTQYHHEIKACEYSYDDLKHPKFTYIVDICPGIDICDIWVFTRDFRVNLLIKLCYDGRNLRLFTYKD